MTPAKTASAPRAASAKKAATASKSAKQPVAGARTAKAKVAPSTAKKAASNNSKAKTKAPAKPPAKKATKAPAKPPAKKATKAPAKKATKSPAKPLAKKATKAPAKVAAKAPTTKAKAAPVTEKAVPPKEKPAAKPKVAKKPSIGPYAKDAKFLEEQRVLLEADRVIYQGQANDLKAEADSLAQEREPGDVQFDEESGEGGTVTVDRERDLALSAQALLAVEEIDHALARIVNKTYGSCERCHQPILKARLRALPYARLCVACKSGGLSRR